MSDDDVKGVALDPEALKAAKKYLSDRDWRIRNLYYIVDYKDRFVKFKPNRVQEHFDANKHTKNIIGKSRQHGFTTWETIDCLDQALFNDNQNIMIITKNKDDASEIFQTKIKRAWEAMNPFVKKIVKIGANTTSMMEFITGDGTKSRFSVGATGIGMTLSRAHISELSYLDVHAPRDADNVIRGVMAAAKFGRIDIESTGRSNVGHFYDYFMNAKDETPNNNSEFKRFFYNWQWDDVKLNSISDEYVKSINNGEGDQWERFKEYKEKHSLTDREIACYYSFWIDYNKNWDLLHSEYPTTIDEMFSSGTDRLFSGDMLDQQIIVEPEIIGRWRYFHEYDDTHKYSIGVDVAEGIGKDSSTIVIIDVTDNKVVAAYASEKIPPTMLAYEILNGAKKYGEPLVAVERNNHGHTTLSKLREIYDVKKIYKEVRKEKQRTQRTFKFGWYTGGHNKPKMFFDLSDMVNTGEISMSDSRIILEARMYSTDNVNQNRPKETDTAHFDLLTAMAIAWQVRVDAMALKSTAKVEESKLTEEIRRLQSRQFMPR